MTVKQINILLTENDGKMQGTHFEEVVQVVAEFLHEVHVGEHGQHEFLGFVAEGQFGPGQPGPVVGVGAPGVGVLEGKGQPVVYGRHVNVASVHQPPVLK